MGTTAWMGCVGEDSDHRSVSFPLYVKVAGLWQDVATLP